MGDAILFGVLRMPSELWGDGVIDKAQRESRYHEAADMIESLRAELERVKGERDMADNAIKEVNGICLNRPIPQFGKSGIAQTVIQTFVHNDTNTCTNDDKKPTP